MNSLPRSRQRGSDRSRLAAAWRALGVVTACAALLLPTSCAKRPIPQWDAGTPPDLERILDALDEGDPMASYTTGRLDLTFTGGFLGDRRLTLGGQVAIAQPDRFRLVGAYGAFKKVFDLVVDGFSFDLFDHRERVWYSAPADDAGAAARLGLAARPGDLNRLLIVGGHGPLEGATDLALLDASADSVSIGFRVPGRDGRWRATFDGGLRLSTLEHTVDGRVRLRVTYGRYRAMDGRTIPQRIAVSHPGGDQRVAIEIRRLDLPDELPADAFVPSWPSDAEHVDVSTRPEDP